MFCSVERGFSLKQSQAYGSFPLKTCEVYALRSLFTREVETEGLKVLGHPRLHSEFIQSQSGLHQKRGGAGGGQGVREEEEREAEKDSS